MTDEIQNETEFKHYGVGHLGGGHSGRYEYGSGGRPYQDLEGTAQYSKLMKNKHAKSGATKQRSDPNSARINIHETKKELDAQIKNRKHLAIEIANAKSGSASARKYLENRKKNLDEVSKKLKDDDKRRSRLKVDAATGFHLRDKFAEDRAYKQAEWESKKIYGKNHTFKDKEGMKLELDSKHVNPGLSGYDAGTTQNCCLCTLTNEMRQRGYDVRAKKLESGMNWSQIGAVFPGVKPSWIPQSEEGSKEWTAAKYGSNKAMNDRINKYVSSQPEGSRGILNYHRQDGSGHAISYEVKKGKAIYTDSQAGYVFDSSNSIYSFGESVTCAFARLDNRVPNLSRLKEVCE